MLSACGDLTYPVVTLETQPVPATCTRTACRRVHPYSPPPTGITSSPAAPATAPALPTRQLVKGLIEHTSI